MSLTAFVVTAVLLITPDSLAFRQADAAGGERQSPELARQAEKLFQEALLLSDTRDGESARLRLQEAMRLWVQLREPGKAAKAALQMGDRCKQARKYQDALHFYNRALEVKLLPGTGRANAWNAIALVYAELYQGDLALHYFIKALDQARAINDLPAQTLVLTGLANLYYQRGEKAKASDAIVQAQKLNRQKIADADPALLCLFGKIRQEEGQAEEAKGAFEESLATCRRTGNVEWEVKSLCAISNLSLISSQKQAALEQAEQAVELAEREAKRASSHADKGRVRELRWRAWLSRARAQRAMGLKDKALKSYKSSTQHIEALWWSVYIATEASAIAFREETQTVYREYVDLSVELGQFNEAYGLADQSKARTILNLTEARRGAPPAEGSRLESALRELARSIVRLRLELLSSESTEQQAKLSKEIADAEYNMQEMQFQAELARSGERLVWSQLASVEQTQKLMAQDQMALAEFSLGEDRSFVWLFTHGEVFFEILPARKKIEEAVRGYLDVLAAPPNYLNLEGDIAKLKKQAEALFAILFNDLSARIEPGQRLIVVPDGLLHYLPFEALVHNGRYLVEDHEISYNSSASMVGLLQDSKSNVDNADKMELLAIGDPVFGPEPKAVGGRGSRNDLRKLARKTRAARGFRLARLPRTRDEIQYIANLFPSNKRKVFLRTESTEEAIKREPLSRYRRLHLATHSLIDEKFPLRSAVVLTLRDNTEEDGFLEVGEISRLNLDCDLVVVSACQTGRGQLLSGEGVVGLSRAFLHAGARSVVVSLWNVSDISTGQLMKGFYQHLVSSTSNAAALRAAKLQMIGIGRETRHPYYWASFVIVGKP